MLVTIERLYIRAVVRAIFIFDLALINCKKDKIALIAVIICFGQTLHIRIVGLAGHNRVEAVLNPLDLTAD